MIYPGDQKWTPEFPGQPRPTLKVRAVHPTLGEVWGASWLDGIDAAIVAFKAQYPDVMGTTACSWNPETDE